MDENWFWCFGEQNIRRANCADCVLLQWMKLKVRTIVVKVKNVYNFSSRLHCDKNQTNLIDSLRLQNSFKHAKRKRMRLTLLLVRSCSILCDTIYDDKFFSCSNDKQSVLRRQSLCHSLAWNDFKHLSNCTWNSPSFIYCHFNQENMLRRLIFTLPSHHLPPKQCHLSGH